MQEYTADQRAQWVDRAHKRLSSAALIIESTDEKALVVKATYKRYWTFPGGIIDEGESPAEAALREAYEEVGVLFQPEDITFGWVAYRKSSQFESYQFVFKAAKQVDTDELLVHLQASEIAEYEWVTKAEVKTNDRYYGHVIEHWANDNQSAYKEQVFTF